MQLDVYHGTEIDNITNILKNGYKVSSDKEWLGSGVYFFESLNTFCDGFLEAKNWVIYVKKYQKWAVLKAKIESNKFIDLVNNIRHREIYDRIRDAAIRKHIEAGFDKKDFKEKFIYVKMETLDIDFIRVLVDAKKDYGYYSYTVRRPQLQICVKNIKVITENELYDSSMEV